LILLISLLLVQIPPAEAVLSTDNQEWAINDGFAQALIGGLVVAGRAAGFAVHKAVAAKTDVNHALAQAAIFLAFATFFRLLALGAAEFRGAHKANVTCEGGPRNMTEVMDEVRDRGLAARGQ